MNGASSSNYRGFPRSVVNVQPGINVPPTVQHGGAIGHMVDQTVPRPPWFQSQAAAADANFAAALRAGLYNPRLESLASQILSLPNAAAAAAAASHLANLQAAASAAVNNSNLTNAQGYQSSSIGLSMAPTSNTSSSTASAISSQQPGALGPLQNQQQHHPLLSPYFFSAAAAAYAAQAAAAGNAATAPNVRPSFLPMDSAFLPANVGLPRYRYHLPNSAANEQMNAGRVRTSLAGPNDNSQSMATMAAAQTFHQQQLQHMRRPSSPAPFTANMSASNFSPTGLQRHGSHRSPITGSMIPIITSTPIGTDFCRPSIASGSRSLSHTDRSPQACSSSKRLMMNVRASLPTQPYYPTHFMRGTWIQLASGALKKVEDLNSEDFINSADLTQDLKVDSSEVVQIEERSEDIVLLSFSVGEQKLKVTVEATQEHPFFVIGQGWSSCNPEKTKLLYGLNCSKLKLKDCCISLTSRDGLPLPNNNGRSNLANKMATTSPSRQSKNSNSSINSQSQISIIQYDNVISPAKAQSIISNTPNGITSHNVASKRRLTVGHVQNVANASSDIAEDLSATGQQGAAKTNLSKVLAEVKRRKIDIDSISSKKILCQMEPIVGKRTTTRRRSSTPLLHKRSSHKDEVHRRYSIS